MRESWDDFFLGMAQYVSKRSKDPSTQVGAVIADINNRIISFGYNGFPGPIEDKPEILNNRELKYKYIIHADINAILNAAHRECLCGATMYVWPFPPCGECAKLIIQSNIIRVVTKKPTPELAERWRDSLSLTRELFKEAGVELIERD